MWKQNPNGNWTYSTYLSNGEKMLVYSSRDNGIEFYLPESSHSLGVAELKLIIRVLGEAVNIFETGAP